MPTIRSVLTGILFFVCLMALALSSAAQQAAFSHARIEDSAGGETWMLLDQNRSTKRSVSSDNVFTLHCESLVSSLYLIWDQAPGEWRLNTPQAELLCGTDSFIHEFIALDSPSAELSIHLGGDAVLCDIYLFDSKTSPDWVQCWQPPLQKADFLLLPTHADDEHLFFGGIMPKYLDKGCAVQVAYMVNHHTEPYRPHELLNGLWAVGIRNYPVIPSFPDMFSDSLAHAKTIYQEQQIIDYQVGLIQRFKPQVIVGHDLDGEYGHGAHMLNAHSLLKAVEIAAPEHDTPKLYLHLYSQNEVVLDYDTPLESFNGKTAFEMAVLGFSKHISQQTYFQVEKAGPYDCRKFGLIKTTVGPDNNKDDLFENLLSYSEQDALAKLEEASALPVFASSSEPVSAGDPLETLSEDLLSVPSANQAPAFIALLLTAGLILAVISILRFFYISQRTRRRK